MMAPVPKLARFAALFLALAACGLMIAGEFSTLYAIKVITVVKQTTLGHENHDYALLVIAIGALSMAYGAIVGGSRAAAGGLALMAVAALVVVRFVDYPVVGKEGFIGQAFEQAQARPRIGFYLESLGAVLLLVTAVGTLLLTPRAAERRVRKPATD
jgi:hypothetical protein